MVDTYDLAAQAWLSFTARLTEVFRGMSQKVSLVRGVPPGGRNTDEVD